MFNRARVGWLGLLLSLALPLMACDEGRTIGRDGGAGAAATGGKGGSGGASTGGKGGAVTDGGAGTGGNGSGGSAGGGTAGATGNGGAGGGIGGAAGGGVAGASGTAGTGGSGGVTGSAGNGGKGGTAGNGGTGGNAAGSGGNTAGAAGNGGRGGTGGTAGTAGNGGAGGKGGSGGSGGSAGSGAGSGGTGGTAVCGAGTHMCSSCVPNTSVNSCGTTSCQACPPPGLANGMATCDGTSCGVGCVTNYSLCKNTNGTNNSCSRTVFDFDDGTAQGWMNTNAGTFSTSSTIRHGSSGASLTFSVTQFGSASETGVHFPLCMSSSMNLMGKQVSAWIYIEGDALPTCGGPLNDMDIHIVNTSNLRASGASTIPKVGQWFQVAGTVNFQGSDTAAEVDIDLYIGCDVTWLGNVYIDDVVIGG